MRTNGQNTAADWKAVEVGGCETVKLMTTHDPGDVLKALARGQTSIVVRLYEDLSNRVVSGSDFASWQEGDSTMRRMYAQGVRLFEIHNEPNLKSEGLGKSWTNGKEFGEWFLAARARLLLAFPGSLFGFPGVSPGFAFDNGVNARAESDKFLKEAQDAMKRADWVAAHCYQVRDDSIGAGGAWRKVREMAPGKKLAITEFSSPADSRHNQAVGYRRFYEKMRDERDVFAAYSFCSSGTSFQGEAWRLENGDLTEIPAEVGKRIFVVPTLPAKTKFTTDQRVRVIPDITALSVRNAPSLVAPRVGFVETDDYGRALGGARYVDNIAWREIKWDKGMQGWSSEAYLEIAPADPDPDRWEKVARALIDVFGSDLDTVTTMLAIGAAESGTFKYDLGDSVLTYPQLAKYACQGYVSFGVFQGNAGVHSAEYQRLTGSDDPCVWYDWSKNYRNAAIIAKFIWTQSGGKFTAWAVYNKGTYKAYLQHATETIQHIFPVPTIPGSGFDAPVGVPGERASETVWEGGWTDAFGVTGYAKKYSDSAGNQAYHTGADLNLNLPGHWDADRDSPVYASANGTVRYAGRVDGYWRNVIIIEHPPLADGTRPITRYAHVANMLVVAGQVVNKGQQIAQVGFSGSSGPYHLHFDVSLTDVLLKSPGDWPGLNLARLKANYVDPITFIRAHRR